MNDPNGMYVTRYLLHYVYYQVHCTPAGGER